MLYQSFIGLSMMCLLMASCLESETGIHQHPEDGLSVVITSPAGSQLDGMANGLVSPFNIGHVKDSHDRYYRIMLLGSRRKDSELVSAQPIALFSYTQDSLVNKYILAVPKDQPELDLGEDFNSFMMNRPYLSNAIEAWFKAQCHEGSCKNFKWDNTYKALLELSNEAEQ